MVKILGLQMWLEQKTSLHRGSPWIEFRNKWFSAKVTSSQNTTSSDCDEICVLSVNRNALKEQLANPNPETDSEPFVWF